MAINSSVAAGPANNLPPLSELRSLANTLPPEKFRALIEQYQEHETRQKAKTQRKAMYDDLLDAWSKAPSALNHAYDHPMNAPYGAPEARTEVEALKASITQKIEHHKRMISTLEWFSSHLKLDQPEQDLLVARVILEGLTSMEQRRDR